MSLAILVALSVYLIQPGIDDRYDVLAAEQGSGLVSVPFVGRPGINLGGIIDRAKYVSISDAQLGDDGLRVLEGVADVIHAGEVLSGGSGDVISDILNNFTPRAVRIEYFAKGGDFQGGGLASVLNLNPESYSVERMNTFYFRDGEISAGLGFSQPLDFRHGFFSRISTPSGFIRAGLGVAGRSFGPLSGEEGSYERQGANQHTDDCGVSLPARIARLLDGSLRRSSGAVVGLAIAIYALVLCGLVGSGAGRWFDNRRGGYSLIGVGLCVSLMPLAIFALSGAR